MADVYITESDVDIILS